MKVSILQLSHNDNETKQERLSKVKSIIHSLNDTELIMLPELWNIGFFSYNKYLEAAESIDGESISMLSGLAREKNTHIFTGSFIENRNGKLYNTAALLSPKGELIGRYSKIHLFGEEARYLNTGNEIPVFETQLGIIGMSICYDLRFPELYRELSYKGAEIFLSCYALPYVRLKHWQLLYPARALENQAVSVSCGCAGINEGIQYAGHSMVIDPFGEIKSEASSDGAVICSDIDVNLVKKYRKDFPVLRDRRI